MARPEWPVSGLNTASALLSGLRGLYLADSSQPGRLSSVLSTSHMHFARNPAAVPILETDVDFTTSVLADGVDDFAQGTETFPTLFSDTQPATLALWVNVASLATDAVGTIAAQGFDTTSSTNAWILNALDTSGTKEFVFTFADTAFANAVQLVSGAITINTWYLVVVTRNGTATNGCKLYINGSLADEATFAFSSASASYPVLFSGSAFANARIPFLAFWDRVLDASEISAMHASATRWSLLSGTFSKMQYRIYTPGDWTSNFGASFLAIQNVSGSGKKITVRSLEAQVASVNNGSATAGAAQCSLYRCTAPLSAGEDMRATASAHDSQTEIPRALIVRRHSVSTAYTDRIRNVHVEKRATTAATVNDPRWQNTQHGLNRNAGIYRSAITVTDVEPLFLRSNQAYTIVCSHPSAPYMMPVRVSITVSYDGATLSWDFVSQLLPGVCVASIEYVGPAGPDIKILKIALAEVGTTDTPTIRVVPIGQIRPGDGDDPSRQNLAMRPMDSAYGGVSGAVCKLFTDVMITPYGVPEVYITPGSTGAPKDMNYLHTRDFDGPMYRNFLPEMCAVKGVGVSMPDTLGLSGAQRWCDLLMARKASSPATPVILNPGEGIALVSSAETAVGVQAAWSGWPLLFFGAVLDIEPATIPTITVSGMIDGSRYQIERVSDATVVTTGVAGVSGEISYLYETQDTPLNLKLKVRKATSAPYYKPYEVTFNLTSAGITLPVSQISDA